MGLRGNGGGRGRVVRTQVKVFERSGGEDGDDSGGGDVGLGLLLFMGPG